MTKDIRVCCHGRSKYEGDDRSFHQQYHLPPLRLYLRADDPGLRHALLAGCKVRKRLPRLRNAAATVALGHRRLTVQPEQPPRLQPAIPAPLAEGVPEPVRLQQAGGWRCRPPLFAAARAPGTGTRELGVHQLLGHVVQLPALARPLIALKMYGRFISQSVSLGPAPCWSISTSLTSMEGSEGLGSGLAGSLTLLSLGPGRRPSKLLVGMLGADLIGGGFLGRGQGVSGGVPGSSRLNRGASCSASSTSTFWKRLRPSRGSVGAETFVAGKATTDGRGQFGLVFRLVD